MIPDWKLIENKDVSSLIARCGVESTKTGLMNHLTSLLAAMKVCKLKRYSFYLSQQCGFHSLATEKMELWKSVALSHGKSGNLV